MEIANTLATRLGELDTTIDTRGQELHDRLASRTGELHTLFDTKGALLIELLSARGGEIAQELSAIGEGVTQSVSNQTYAIANAIAAKQAEITQAIDVSSTQLRQAIDTSANGSVATLLGVNDRMKGELTNVLDQLGVTNQSLEKIISTASTNLEAIETSVGERLRDFQSALNIVSNQINLLNDTASSTLHDAGQLATTIDEHHRTLALSAGELARTQAELDTSLASRRVSLEALLSNINTKREDFENVMRSFTGLVDETFRNAETRAREIGAFLVESSQATAGIVDQQFSEIRNVTGRERERTAAAMRTAYEQANAELTNIFSQTTERFRATADEMRGMASEVQKELESTRKELAHNAAVLPQETAEQANAMRRVVNEQIQALGKLSAIVGTPERAFDVMEPTKPAEPRRAEPTRDDVLRARVPLATPRAPVAPQRPAAPAPAAPAASAERGPGWLSDLLARAEKDEKPAAPTAPARNAGPLDNLSLDIASMINHEESVDAWERYRKGEDKTFTRRLYTLQGQQTFDEIRRRYRSDQDFRGTVDRYVSEFERLLTEISRDDRDGSVTRSYLISDTGKVYTMLAHASGRIE